MKDAVKTAKPKMAARRSKEHKIPIMKVGRSKRPAKEAPRRKRGRPKGEEKGRKRKAVEHPRDAPPKRPKMAVNGDAKRHNGALKKTKKNNCILKGATFHPPISKRELLNGSSSLSTFKFLPSKNKSSFKRDVEVNSSETSSKGGKVNNTGPLSQSAVSNELGRNLEKDTVQFSSKEPSKSKDVSKLVSKETAKSQSKESPKSASKESSKIHPKETSKPQVKDSGKPQTHSKSLHKEQASKPLIKDSAKPKDVVRPVTSTKSQPKEPVPVKSHPQRMASLDAMAKMHVICTTDRKPPEPRQPPAVTHQKSITQCHERIQFDLKKETNEGNVVQEIKQQVFVSHSVEQSSVVEHEPSKTVSTKVQQQEKKKKPADKKSVKAKPSKCPKAEKPKDGGDKKVQPKKKEVKVKETIRLQKTCTYESVTTVSSASASVVPVITTNFSSKNSSSSPSSCCRDCCKFRPIPLAHACSPAAFSVHRFQAPIILAPECGCCCTSTLDSCLLRKSLVAFPHLPSHHAHHLSAPAFSSETVCSDCHPSSAPEYTIRSPPRTCCCDLLHHRHHHGSVHRYLSKASSSPVPYAAEQSPLDLSTTAASSQRALLCCRPEQQQLLLLRPQLHHTCCRCGKEAEPVLASGPVHPPVASTSAVTDDKSPTSRLQRRLSFAHGWSWKGKPRERLVALTNDSLPCARLCYPSVEHQEGDTISERDCVLLRSGPKETDLPYVAKVAAFWENPDDGEMMMSLLWYYRPEHTDAGRKTGQMEDEVFASRHKDVNSVACIEDKCYVLTYNEYCRYKASLSMDGNAVCISSRVVPQLPDGYPRKNRLPCEPVSQDIVFFCRHVYDFRQKRILKNPT